MLCRQQGQALEELSRTQPAMISSSLQRLLRAAGCHETVLHTRCRDVRVKGAAGAVYARVRLAPTEIRFAVTSCDAFTCSSFTRFLVDSNACLSSVHSSSPPCPPPIVV